MEGMPTSLRQKELTRSKIWLRVLVTRQLVGIRSSATRAAASTLLLVLARSCLTTRTPTQQSGLPRFYSTPTVARTQRLGPPRLRRRPSEQTIRPLERSLCPATARVPITQPSVTARFLVTPAV